MPRRVLAAVLHRVVQGGRPSAQRHLLHHQDGDHPAQSFVGVSGEPSPFLLFAFIRGGGVIYLLLFTNFPLLLIKKDPTRYYQSPALINNTPLSPRPQ